jgi:hypothetical protein
MAQLRPITVLTQTQQRWVSENVRAGILAMRSTAHRVQAYYVNRTRAVKAVDTGHMMRAFQVDTLSTGAVITNAAPYFPVMDEGRRPGTFPPFDAIYQWVLRKRLVRAILKSGRRANAGMTRAAVMKSALYASEAVEIARAIQRKIARRGIKPRQIATGHEPHMMVIRILDAEFERAMQRRRGGGGGGGMVQ